jgi:hypothetical protein
MVRLESIGAVTQKLASVPRGNVEPLVSEIAQKPSEFVIVTQTLIQNKKVGGLEKIISDPPLVQICKREARILVFISIKWHQ